MNELDQNHKDYLQTQAEIDQFSQDLDKKNKEVQNLQAQLTGVSLRITEIEDKLKHSQRDMAEGLLTSDEYLALKQELQEKQARQARLTEAFNAQKSASELIQNKKSNASSYLMSIKKDLAHNLSTQAVNKIIENAEGEVKALINALVTTYPLNKSDHEVVANLHKDIGIKLCDKLFSSKSGVEFPSYFEANKAVDQLITELS